MSSLGNRDELAQRVVQWYREEFGMVEGSSQYVPNKEEIKILCRGNMLSVWAFFLERVRSIENVADVRANLMLQQNKKRLAQAAAREQELKRLKAQRESVSASLDAARAKLKSVETEVQALKQEVTDNSTRLAEQRHRGEALEKRALVLAALDQKTLTDALVIREYISRLRQALSGPSPTTNCGDHHPNVATNGTEQAVGVAVCSLEGGTLRQVREVWEVLRSDLVQALESGNLRQPETLSFHRQVRSLEGLDGGQILQCLSAIAAQDLSLLTEDESAAFAHASGWGEVRWRIKQGQEAHEHRFVETQAVLNEARSARFLCQSLQQQQPLTHDTNEGAQRLREAEVKLEGSKLALKALGEYVRKTDLAKETYQRLLAPLQTKVAQIRSLEAEHKDKQRSVAWLSARVAKERALLLGEQAKTKPILRQTLKAFRTAVPEAVASLRSCLVPVPDLPLTPIPSSPAWDASLGTLSVPPYGAPSSLLPRVAEVKYRERELIVKTQRWAQLSGLGTNEGDQTLSRLSRKRAAALKELSKLVEDQRKVQESAWIPALAGCERNAINGLKQVPVVHQYVQHWWEQPGQLAAPFVRVRGKNVEEWLQAIRCQTHAPLSPL